MRSEAEWTLRFETFGLDAQFQIGFLIYLYIFFFISFHLFFTAFACLSFSSQDIPKNLLKIIFPPL